jgi:hypothetical protein
MMPLPMDLASVAWLAIYRHSGKDRPWNWLDHHHYLALRRHVPDPRVLEDFRAVVRDQQTYIRTLEDQLLPYLTRLQPEQETML